MEKEIKDGTAPEEEPADPEVVVEDEVEPPEIIEVEEPFVFEEPIDAAMRERDEMKALVQRVQADFVNYRNRVAVEREEIRRNSTRRMAVKVLDALDQFDSALDSERPRGVEDSWFAGFEGIRRGLLQVLSSEGIEPFESVGDQFDPRFHEALLTAESGDVPASTVLNVLRRGYKMNDDVIRAAQVQISTAPASTEETEESTGE
ncbi:MAG TPA: nucleotide exchange factor GrpE [Dehalococcoidia bacterium]|nr:nucleotide exchange factor GrpE [Dehalococcoidia bacterium]